MKLSRKECEIKNLCFYCQQRNIDTGFSTCTMCRKRFSSYRKKYRHNKEKKLCKDNLCLQCGLKKAEQDRTRCSDCLEYHRKKAREKQNKNRVSGLCIYCGKNIPRKNKFSCKKCATRRKTPTGRCHNCKLPTMEHSSCYCKKHWFIGTSKQRLNDGTVGAGRFLEELLVNQNYKCPYTGKILIPGVNCWLDHILPTSRFPELKYNKNNVEWVDKTVNLCKHNRTKEEFIKLCKQVVVMSMAKEYGVEVEVQFP